MFFWKSKPKVKAIEITDDNFEELVINSDKPVLVDFWGEGCGPCRIIGPFVDDVAKNYHERAVVGKICTNYNPKVAMRFKIRSVPSILFFNKGKLVERYTGLIPQPNLERILDNYLEEG